MSERTWNPIETAPVEEIKALQLARLFHLGKKFLSGWEG